MSLVLLNITSSIRVSSLLHHICCQLRVCAGKKVQQADPYDLCDSNSPAVSADESSPWDPSYVQLLTSSLAIRDIDARCSRCRASTWSQKLCATVCFSTGNSFACLAALLAAPRLVQTTLVSHKPIYSENAQHSFVGERGFYIFSQPTRLYGT